MSEKIKVGQGRASARGLGYLTVLVLIAAALVIGAGHEPLTQFIDALLAAAAPSPASPVSSPSDTPVESQRIESLIRTHTDVTVLTVTVADSIRVEYLLVPQAAMRTDQIHDQQMLKIICALRHAGLARRPTIFVGVGRFRDQLGKTVYRSRVATKLSALENNRIVCRPDTSATDVNWRRISEYYKTYPIPSGLAIDT